MKTEIITPREITRALEILNRGGLVAFPTDTVYGLGALAFDGKAVESIYQAKDRPAEKAIPVLIGETDDLQMIASQVPEMARKLAARFWPGPLTLVIPKKPEHPEVVSSTDTVAVRIPDHKVARELLRKAGPLAVTSANISSQPSPSTADEVYAQLGGRIALIIDGGIAPGGLPSTLVDCTGDKPIILREGPITLDDLLSVLHSS